MRFLNISVLCVGALRFSGHETGPTFLSLTELAGCNLATCHLDPAGVSALKDGAKNLKIQIPCCLNLPPNGIWLGWFSSRKREGWEGCKCSKLASEMYFFSHCSFFFSFVHYCKSRLKLAVLIQKLGFLRDFFWQSYFGEVQRPAISLFEPWKDAVLRSFPLAQLPHLLRPDLPLPARCWGSSKVIFTSSAEIPCNVYVRPRPTKCAARDKVHLCVSTRLTWVCWVKWVELPSFLGLKNTWYSWKSGPWSKPQHEKIMDIHLGNLLQFLKLK